MNIADQQLVVFELDGEEFGVPILEVKEIVKDIQITPVPDSPPFILGIINLRGKIAPVVDMEKKFGLDRSTPATKEHIVMYEDSSGGLFGVQVDKVKGVLKITEADIKVTPKAVSSKIAADYLRGVVVVEDRVILIVDLPKILNKDTVELKV